MKPDIPGQDETAVEVFKKIGLSEADLDLFFTIFWDIDSNSSGSIRPVELFSYFNVDLGSFESSIFAIFDEERKGLLNFMEYVCALWNLLTLADADLGVLGYLMKDPTGVLRIKPPQVREIMETIHKKKVEASPALVALYSNLKHEYPGEISIQDFCKWCRDNPSVLTPVVILQIKLRKLVIGEKFWLRQMEARRDHKEMGKHDFVRKLANQIKAKNDAFKAKKAHEEVKQAIIERRGKSAKGDTRSGVAKRESFLLKAFKLSGKSSSSKVYVEDGADGAASTASDGSAISGSNGSSSKQGRKPNTSSSKIGGDDGTQGKLPSLSPSKSGKLGTSSKQNSKLTTSSKSKSRKCKDGSFEDLGGESVGGGSNSGSSKGNRAKGKEPSTISLDELVDPLCEENETSEHNTNHPSHHSKPRKRRSMFSKPVVTRKNDQSSSGRK